MYSRQPQQKVCPRCRFILSKTHTQKMICKRCGYTTNKLQIVTEEDTFNVNIKFSKRVTVRPDREVQQQVKTQQNSLESYMKTYQAIVRRLGGRFMATEVKDSVQQRQRLSETYKNLWFGYLEKMSKQGNVIAGIFTGLMDREERKEQLRNKSKTNESKKPHKLEQDSVYEGSSSDNDNNQHKQQQQQQLNNNKRSLQQQSDEENNSKKKQQKQLGSDKWMKIFKKIINSAVKKLKDSVGGKDVQGVRREMLEKLIDEGKKQSISELEEQCSFTSLTYMSDRYCWMLGICQFIQHHNNTTNRLKNNKRTTKKSQQQHQPIQKRLQQKYVRQQELRQLCKERGLQYEKRRLFVELNILCYDLLLEWWSHNSIRNGKYLQLKGSMMLNSSDNLPYAYLLESYKQSTLKPPYILKHLILTLQKMSQQVLIKQQQIAKKLPQLSLKFICALIYLSVVINQHTHTILEVVNFVQQELFVFGQEIVGSNSNEDKVKREILGLLIKEKNVKVKRVRKVAHQLFNYLSSHLCGINLCLDKWCNKYSLLFNLPQKVSNQLHILVQTLFKTLTQHTLANSINNNHLVNNFTQRFMVIQQPEIVLSCLVIYLKLVFGLDRSQQPYLVNIGEVWGYIKGNMEFIEDERQREMVGFVEKMLDDYKEMFNFGESTQNNGQKQQYFGLLKLLHNINTSFKPITHINQLKYITFKQQKQLSTKIHQFKSIIPKKQHTSSLSLVYNLNNLSDKNIHKIQPIDVKYVKNQQNQRIQQNEAHNNTQHQQRKVHQVFAGMRVQTKVSLNPNLCRAIDYLEDKYKRFHEKKREKNQVEQQNRKMQQNAKQNNKMRKQQHKNITTSKIDETIDNKSQQQQQFNLSQYLDNPAAHYELVYHPTINNLQMLQLKQLLTVVQTLSLHNNGEYTDCSDILEWLGSLESVLKEFES